MVILTKIIPKSIQKDSIKNNYLEKLFIVMPK
ncbi:Uncharacterised protein [Yersinia massiliensis]|nr:Uncharacterised protein [Yersinia massiliensis]